MATTLPTTWRHCVQLGNRKSHADVAPPIE